MSGTVKFVLIATIFLVSLAAGWYFLVYRPDAQRLNSVEGDVEDLVLKLRSFTVSEKQIAALEAQIEKLRNQVALTESKLITKDDLSFTLQQIKKRGNSYGLKFEQILPDFDSLMDDPEEETSTHGIMKLRVDMKLKGRYKRFGKFVASFGTFPFHVSIADMRIFYNQQIHPELDIVVEALLYLRRQKVSQART